LPAINPPIRMNTRNPYAPPEAEVADVAGPAFLEAAPALWNPAAAASWSLIFSPIFGSWLQMKNWQALGESEKAAKARTWVWVCCAFFTALIVLGAILLVPSWQARLAAAGGPVSSWADRYFGGFASSGLAGQFAVGLLLGAVWSPCVGPTLGAATTLASQGQSLAQISLLMVIFGLGAGTPLVALGSVSRATMIRLRGRMLSAGKMGKSILGIILALLGIAILSGLDKSFEAWVVEIYPDWLNDLTTRY